jgi:hypothetical protein
LAVVLLARIRDFRELGFLPSLEIAWVHVLGKTVKDVILAVVHYRYIDQPKGFSVLALQLDCMSQIANRLFARGEHDTFPTMMCSFMR